MSDLLSLPLYRDSFSVKFGILQFMQRSVRVLTTIHTQKCASSRWYQIDRYDIAVLAECVG